MTNPSNETPLPSAPVEDAPKHEFDAKPIEDTVDASKSAPPVDFENDEKE